MMHKLWFVGIILLIAGCGRTVVPATTKKIKPADQFSRLEARLLTAATVRLAFHVTATGAVEADIKGELVVNTGAGMKLVGKGTLAGQPVDLSIFCEDGRCEYRNGIKKFDGIRPPNLKESVLVGLTRMGILHNLFRLSNATAPDHSNGNVRQWVTVGSFAGNSANPLIMNFNLTVDGKPSGMASLEMDEDHLPVKRQQTVKFTEGEMLVVEKYTSVSIDP